MFQKKLMVLLTLSILTTVSQGEEKVFDDRQICKAAISLVMGIEPNQIMYDQDTSKEIYLSYRLKDEKEVYRYRCKIEGNRVIWASASGRWRTQKDDAMITYYVNSDRVTVEERYLGEEGLAGKSTFRASIL